MIRALVCLSLTALSCFCQIAAFDVASIRPHLSDHSGDRRSSTNVSVSDEGIKLTATNVSLVSLIQRAHDVKEYQVAGPDWLRTAYFDLLATLPAGVPREQLIPALRALLAERFKLALHREKKDLPMYALVVAKNGPKLQPTADPNGPNGTWNSKGKFTGKNETLAHFSEALSRQLDRAVVDMTELTGAFDFEVAYGPEDAHSNSDDSGPSIFAALQEKLGLKLEARKGPVELLIIDRIEKTPTEN
jgi:uncharacterized protein (TIGR03435 family)